MRKITEIPATVFSHTKEKKKKLRVAAYCRVSTEKEEQENSLENQIAYYKNKIENTSDWVLVDIFADFGISGISDKNRLEFQRMMNICEKGKIDLIIVKSISRFSRNTVDCLNHIRRLKAMNIGVIFEKEGINTLDAISETFLTWFSAFAQAESESLSQNVTRGKRMGYKEGKFAFPGTLYGFEKGADGNPIIIPEQASVIKKIFHLYLEGYSVEKIQLWLEEHNILSPKGMNKWGHSTVASILRNEKYMGDVLLQKTYTVDFLTKSTVKNNGEVTQYYITDNHQGIVSKEVFNQVQDEIKRRSDVFQGDKLHTYSSTYALTGKVICGECGARYRRVTWAQPKGKKIVWRCIERLTNGRKNCRNSPTIYEKDLHDIIIQSIYDIVADSNDIKDTVKNEIEAVLFENDEYNPKVIKRKIRNIEKETSILKCILKETDDKDFYVEKICKLENELLELNTRLECVRDKQSGGVMYQIEQLVDDTDLNINEYFNTLVRHCIENITVLTDNRIKIKYFGGLDITKAI